MYPSMNLGGVVVIGMCGESGVCGEGFGGGGVYTP